MKEISLENERLAVRINCHGAELRSIRDKITDIEYLWQADPKFWGRSSPILFPFVGSVKDKTYRYEGRDYPMNQHGFARDMEFELILHEEREAWLELCWDEETYKAYPFCFRLAIGYRLEKDSISVMWRVRNADDKEMYFSIGAHPAFCCPLHTDELQSSYFLGFRRKNGMAPDSLLNTVFGKAGLVTDQMKEYLLRDGLLPVDEHLFDGDALVIENSQVQRVALLDGSRKEYLAVEFDAPLVGIWSPPKKQAPFVCIEPWYGRCDSDSFEGELKDRKWGNTLAPEEEFYAEYKIVVPD